MKNITIGKIIELTGGKLLQGNLETICKRFSHDTRTIQVGDVYVGILGEKQDGSIYWEQAFERGAETVLINEIEINRNLLKQWEDKAIIQVSDTVKALGEIASYKRELYGKNFPLIGVTGSVGKTSTKDMIASVISKKYETLKTQGNYNNHIGVPLTLLSLQDEEAAVVEMGMNHEGEIRYLSEIAKPVISVITNVGTSHIGNLGSRENILKAKLEILEGMEEKKLVMNHDNDMLQVWNEEEHSDVEIHTYGVEKESDIWADKIVLQEDGSKFICHIGEKQIEIFVPVGGKHFVYNALCAVCVGDMLGLTLEEIKRGIESFELTKKRMDLTELSNGVTIINDSYNASLESMRASLAYLASFKNRGKIAVLGDMFELGEFAKELHQMVGEAVSRYGIDLLICHGNHAKAMAEKAIEMGMDLENVIFVEEKNNMVTILKNHAKKGDIVLFKASNGMRFYDLADVYQKEIEEGL